MSDLAKVGRLLAGYRRGDATFTGVSCQELQRTHLNIFNSVFLHHRDFRFPLVTTEPVFWEFAILDNQLYKYPVFRLKFGIVAVQGYLFPPHYGGEAIFHFPPRVPDNGGEITPKPRKIGENTPKWGGNTKISPDNGGGK